MLLFSIQAPVSPLEATLACVAKSAITFSMDANGDGVLDASEGELSCNAIRITTNMGRKDDDHRAAVSEPSPPLYPLLYPVLHLGLTAYAAPSRAAAQAAWRSCSRAAAWRRR